MSVKSVLVFFVIVATALGQEQEGNLVLARARRSPQYLFGPPGPSPSHSSASVGADRFRPPYYQHQQQHQGQGQGQYSQNRPNYYNFRPSRFEYNPLNNYLGSPSVHTPISYGFHPGNGYYNNGYHHAPPHSNPGHHNQYNTNDFMNWIMPPQTQSYGTSPTSSSEEQTSGVLLWVPLESARYHIQLEQELEYQRELEQQQEQQAEQQKLYLLNLHQQALLEQQQQNNHPPPNLMTMHSVPLLDNNDADFIPDNGVQTETLYYPISPNQESFNDYPGIVPISEVIGMQYTIHPGLMEQPESMESVEETYVPHMLSLYLQPPKKPSTPSSSIPKRSSPPLPRYAPRFPKSTTPRSQLRATPSRFQVKSTSPAPSRAPRPSIPSTTSTTETPSTPSIDVLENNQSPSVLNEIRKRSPTLLREKTNDVEIVEIPQL